MTASFTSPLTFPIPPLHLIDRRADRNCCATRGPWFHFVLLGYSVRKFDFGVCGGLSPILLTANLYPACPLVELERVGGAGRQRRHIAVVGRWPKQNW